MPLKYAFYNNEFMGKRCRCEMPAAVGQWIVHGAKADGLRDDITALQRQLLMGS